MRKIICAYCGISSDRPTGEVNRAIKNGSPLYCSKTCYFHARKVDVKAPGWHARRFEEQQNAVRQDCEECGRAMWLPPSKIGEYHRCGPECNAAHREKLRSSRMRSCVTCGSIFHPRTTQIANGIGIFCSQSCNTAGRLALNDPEAIEKKILGIRKAREEGRWRVLSGPDNPRWMGGIEAYRERQKISGKSAERLRKYRSKNRDKVKEFTQRRRDKKIGRLEYGSIPRIGKMQRWKCAICKVGVRKTYHVDHIVPLARGGEHAARNIQLLCPSCNVRKSAKDPIAYMQSLGKLL